MASAKASIEKSLNVLNVPQEACTTALELNSNTALSGANDLPQLIFRTAEKVLGKALLNSLKAQSALHKAMSFIVVVILTYSVVLQLCP